MMEDTANANDETVMFAKKEQVGTLQAPIVWRSRRSRTDTEEALDTEKGKKAETSKELMGTMKYISGLHGECDWLLKYFDARKEARTSEIDSLSNAKAVLSGADFSLLQRTSAFLARH
mmetsp:Transcript_16360/g.45404  ORF Transcript_16360/g.45404 Transcript_16360/m.45404 type:complete len:118 (+) Transcript_16360:573-926(+)